MPSDTTYRSSPSLLLILAALLPATPARAEQAPARPPIWTTVPTPVDRSKETRERIEPPAPPREQPRHDIVLGPVRAADSATLVIDGTPHRIPGLLAIATNRICTDAEGRRWACGLRSRGALSALVSGSPLRCRPPEAPPVGGTPTIDCRLAGRPLAERIVEEGWAELDDEGRAVPALAAAFERAVRDRRGIWSRAAP